MFDPDDVPALQPLRPDQPQAANSQRVEVVDSIFEVDRQQWNALVEPNDPFTEYEFLALLEESQSVGERTGWYPRHLLLREAGGQLVGAVPLYLKDNSYGEYIFDWGWADAAISAGLPYYPKLVAAVPFTPVSGRRLLVAPGERRREIESALAAALEKLCARLDVLSVHLLFLSQSEFDHLQASPPYLPRITHQFHWTNDGYRSFADYLSRFRHNTRKSVRRDRRRAADSGLRIETIDGVNLSDDQWDVLFQLYRDTTGRKWGQRYLTRAFFELLRQRLAHRVVVTMASEGNRPVAGALSFHKGTHLYGRYWGSLQSYDSLHFELCYYRPIELCIARGYERFEAGAQGNHKLKRGLLPYPTYSVHLLRHEGLRQAVANYLQHERSEVCRDIAGLAEHGPFRRD